MSSIRYSSSISPMDTLPKPEPWSDEALTASPPAVSQVSDGGVTAWRTVLGGWLALFSTFGYVSSFGVYQDFYVRAGTSSSSNISWIGSVQLFLLIGMGLPAGRLLDKGYFKHTIAVGSIIYIFSLFMLSLADVNRYYQLFLSQGVGAGLGAGLIYVPSMAVQAHHWQSRRALAMGIAITGTSCGGIMYPIMLNHLFHGSVGFAWGVRASAFLTLGLLITANLLMRARPRTPQTRPEIPEIPKSNLKEIVTDLPYMFMIAGSFLVLMGLFFPYFYLQLYADFHNLPTNFAFYTLTIQNGVSTIGRTLPNLFADKFGVLNFLIAMTVGTGVLVFTMFGLKNVGGVAIFAIFYGFFSGGVLALLSPVLVGFSRDISEVGIRMGVGYFLASFAFLFGPPISGALLSNAVHWSKPIIFSGVTVIAGIPALVFSRSLLAKRKKNPFV